MKTIAKPGSIKININKDDYQEYRIVMLGDMSVGKTSILDRYINRNFSEKHNQTIAVDLRHVQASSNITVSYLNFWDFSGEQQFWNVRKEFYEDANMIILVFDLASRKSFNSLNEWTQEANNMGATKLPVLVVGNKQDKRNISENEGQDWAKQRSYHYIEVSALQNSNIDSMFKLIKDILSQKK
ncbi:unnamed protein product (macronuclear) [Paramecium tetraurelia]|uniref:GTP-binding protein n=1 Tax=Paramecium tetraurelia TaxID=5888 RepID=A0DMK2_PARTE|nr:uncharacterized protein GSPATT00018487001 [Paramecium tetraurelia]CAK84269.1 unnamed protein product [Paramecium tetraurelia]|eukprot:XP_001451666.1 hypothetical protein (macronuclear) [Paramecium tetraurelia strain d4-2]